MTDISLNADSGASREGGALFLVIFAAALIGMMIPSMMAVTNSEMRMNAAAVRHSRARYAAESVLEHGFAQTDRLIRAQSHYDRFLLKRDGGLVQPAIPDIQADLTRGGWEVQDVELLAGIVPLGDRRFIDPSDDGNELDELRGQYVISRYVMMMAKATVAHGVLGTSTAYAQQYLEIRDSPLFAYAIFYNDIMGLTPGPHTEIHGPVHCNQHMILRPWGGLDYHSQVNTVGGYKRLGGEFTFPGLYGGQLTPEFTLTDGTKGWWDTFNFPPDADFVSEFGRWFGENLRTERHDLRQVYPPAFGDMVPLADGSPGLHRIIQAPLRRSDPRLSAEEWEELLPIEQQKFSTKAGIVFQVDVSPAPIPTLAAWGGLYDGTQLALHEDGRILYPTRVIRFDNDTNRPVLDAHGNYVFIDIPSTATREWFDSLDHQELLLRDNDKINITPWEARHAFLSTLYTEGQLYDVSIRAFRYEPSDSGDYFRNGERHTRVEITGSIPRLHDNSPDGIFRTHYHEGSPGSSGVFHKQTGRNFERDGQDRVTQWLLNSNEYGNFGNIPADFLPDGGPAPRMMWDSRRRQWVNMVDLDIGNLKKALDGGSLAPAWNGIVYVEFLHNGAPIEDTFQDVHGNLFPYEDRAYSRSGLRVINARRVPTTEGPDGLDDGFTLATNNAMYVKGSFNADGNMNTGTAQEPDVPSTDSAKAEVPTALIADSLTLLSDNWNDSMSRADVNRTRGSGVEGPNHRARPTHLEIAAAVITGMPPGDELPWDSRTVQFTHNGGPLNQLRLLEFFGEDVITRFRGSLVQLYEHTVSWEPWRLRYTYLPPRREYGFAQIFENGRYPPGTPTVQSFRRAIYRQIGPDTYGALANILKQTSAEDWSEKEYAEALNAVYGN
ncbi:MAG: hypothetical protein JJU05_06990 [Verrucomicrobia bacterium]|nr:hypothetical protein [Verrucomicrobiota bacterium]MCH8526042.1 hypothetical protein [Kiritimatiellia bacterium]